MDLRELNRRRSIGSTRASRLRPIQRLTGWSRSTTDAIYNTEGEPLIFGDLREKGTKFVAWFPLHWRPQFNEATEEIVKELLPHRFVEFVAEWENPLKSSAERHLIDYKVEKHTDRDRLHIAAEAAVRNPEFKTSINISLALRNALRRYLRIDPAGSKAIKQGD